MALTPPDRRDARDLFLLGLAAAELQQEGLASEHAVDFARVEALSDAGVATLWAFHRMVDGDEAEAEALLRNQDPELVAAVREARSAVGAQRAETARRDAARAWIRSNPEAWDRLTRVEEADADRLDWLAAQDPDTWHAVAEGWNWDDGLEPLVWIVHQPDCDRATALMLFFLGGADDVVTWDADEASEQQRLIRHLAVRLGADGFARAELAFDDPGGREGYLTEQARVRPLPWPELGPEALRPAAGRAVRSDFHADNGCIRRRVDLEAMLEAGQVS